MRPDDRSISHQIFTHRRKGIQQRPLGERLRSVPDAAGNDQRLAGAQAHRAAVQAEFELSPEAIGNLLVLCGCSLADESDALRRARCFPTRRFAPCRPFLPVRIDESKVDPRLPFRRTE